MQDQEPKPTKHIHNLFPISSGSVKAAHERVYLPFKKTQFEPFLSELDDLEKDGDSSLYEESIRKAFKIADGVGRHDFNMFYLLGVLVCRKALKEEAQSRGGFLTPITQDTIEVYMSDDSDRENNGDEVPVPVFLEAKNKQEDFFFTNEEAFTTYYPRALLREKMLQDTLFMVGLLETYRIYKVHHELSSANERVQSS